METLKIGFELEFETPTYKNVIKKGSYTNPYTEAKRILGAKKGDVHTDGSLSYGFEFASKPGISRDFLDSGDTKWRQFFINLKRNMPIEALQTCGMHVHVDKRNLTLSDTLRMAYFIYSNKNLCVLIAGRECKDYAPYNFVGAHAVMWNAYKGQPRYTEQHKYKAINVGRPDTVEFRLFKSVTKFKDFMRHMQFVIALVEFVKTSGYGNRDYYKNIPTPHVGEIDEMGGKFCVFVAKQRKKYRYLYDFLKSQGLG